jgi:diaminopimelate decarboxylase
VTAQETNNQDTSNQDTTNASPLAPEWLAVPGDLNALQAPMWAKSVDRNDDGGLAVGGLSVASLKEQFGTPLFVMDEADFRARARAFKDSFDAAFADICGGVDVYYAGKSFLCTAVVKWVEEEGLRLDTAPAVNWRSPRVRESRGSALHCTATTSPTPRSTGPWT